MECHGCGKKGHFTAMCHSRQAVRSVDSSKDDQTFVGVVQKPKSDNAWNINLEVKGKPMNFKIDTGADVSVIPYSLFKSITANMLNPAKKILSGPSKKTLPVKGQFTANLRHQNKEVLEEVFVVRRLRYPLLGRPAIEFLGLISRLSTVQTKTDFGNSFQSYLKA